MILLLQIEAGSIASWIQTLGFPIALSLGLLFFAYKVYQNQTSTLKEKDDQIRSQIAYQQQFADKLLDSQETINKSIDAQTDFMRDIKYLIHNLPVNQQVVNVEGRPKEIGR